MTLTESIGHYLQPIVGNKRVLAIPSGIEVPHWISDKRRSEGAHHQNSHVTDEESDRPKILLAVGRLSAEKGFDRLLQAWSIAYRQLPGWNLHIAGDGALREALQSLGRSLQIEHRISWLGWQADIWRILSNSDAFVLSSRYEGFPLSILEAMAVGLPVITLNCTDAIGTILEDKHDGWVIPRSNDGPQLIRSLADGLVQVLADPVLCQSMGEHASHSVQRYYWPKVAVLWDQLLEDMVNQ